MGNVGIRLWKAVHWSSIGLLWHCWTHYRQMTKTDSNLLFYSTHSFLLFKTWGLQYPQCILATVLQHTCIRFHAASSGATETSYYYFHICSSTPQDLWTHFIKFSFYPSMNIKMKSKMRWVTECKVFLCSLMDAKTVSNWIQWCSELGFVTVRPRMELISQYILDG